MDLRLVVGQNYNGLIKDLSLLPEVLVNTSQNLLTSPVGRPQISYDQSTERSTRRKTTVMSIT